MSGPSYPPPSSPPPSSWPPPVSAQPAPRGPRRVLRALVAVVAAIALVAGGFAIGTFVLGAGDDGDDTAGRSTSPDPTGSADPTGPTDEPTDGPTDGPTDDPTEAAGDWATDGPAVKDAASVFVETVQTYGPAGLDDAGELPDYRAAVAELVTPELEAEFLRTVPLAEKQTFTSRTGSKAEIDAIGVARLGADAAQVLVAATVTRSRGEGSRARAVGQPLADRVRVDLVRTDGAWRVRAFTSVSGGRGGSTGSTGRDPDQVPEPAREAEVAAREALETILSYDYRTLGADQARATDVLTYSYGREYRNVLSAVAREARRARAVNTSEVVSSGVSSLTGSEGVSVLLFADQTSRNRDGRVSTEARALLRMRLVDGEWLVDGLVAI